MKETWSYSVSVGGKTFTQAVDLHDSNDLDRARHVIAIEICAAYPDYDIDAFDAMRRMMGWDEFKLSKLMSVKVNVVRGWMVGTIDMDRSVWREYRHIVVAEALDVVSVGV